MNSIIKIEEENEGLYGMNNISNKRKQFKEDDNVMVEVEQEEVKMNEVKKEAEENYIKKEKEEKYIIDLEEERQEGDDESLPIFKTDDHQQSNNVFNHNIYKGKNDKGKSKKKSLSLSPSSKRSAINYSNDKKSFKKNNVIPWTREEEENLIQLIEQHGAKWSVIRQEMGSLRAKEGFTVVLGSQWGDEGKGKLVDILAQEADICARCAGGNNAGHTIVVNGSKYDFHMLPSGLVNPKCVSLIGSGVVIHLPSFFEEVRKLEEKGINTSGRLFVSDRAHLVFDFHQIVDGLKEIELGISSIGTTKKGIGPAYSTKASRSGLRVHHLLDHDFFAEKFRRLVINRRKRYGDFEYDIEAEIKRYKELTEQLKPYIIDGVVFIHKCLSSKKKILVEGANALMLDIDFGTYPYVTSSNTTIGGVITGLGIPPSKINKIIGVVKAYTTRVGGGPFPTELTDETAEHLQNVGAEYGTTTGRKRRVGWLDLVVLKYSTILNGYTSLNITKLDVLDDFSEIQVATEYSLNGESLESFPADLNVLEKIKVKYETLPGWKTDISKCRQFTDLPTNAQKYIKFIEKHLELNG
nr:3951_t:CDS:10 [Entrophospora candida]